MSSVTLSLILEKISSKDKDFRYMATSDLANELAKPKFQFDSAATEKQVSDVVLNQLEDQSSDISSLANKCLGLLVRRARDDRLQEIATTLVGRMTGGKKEQQRDVASLGLKTVVAEVPAKSAEVLAAAAAPLLIEGLRSESSDVVSNSLDALTEITARHKSALPDPDALRQALMPELDESRAGLRKRAVHCLAMLAASLPPSSLDVLCHDLFARLEAAAAKPDQVRAYLHALGALSRSVGFKLGPHLARAVPVALQRLGSAGQGDDEARELCLSALESFVQRTPAEARPFLPDITAACLQYLRYDPNYAPDDEMEEAGGSHAGSDEEEEEEEEAYSDDEDTSWKVRRAAAKVAAVLVAHYPDLLQETYRQLAPALVARFKEREEAVRPDVYQAYIELARAAGAAVRRGDQTAAAALAADVPGVVKALARQLRARASGKTKVWAFKALQEVARAAPESAGACLEDLIPGVKSALEDRSPTAPALKIEALHFLNAALAANPPATVRAAAAALAPAVFSAAGDRYYVVSAEALRACELLVRVIRPAPPAPPAPDLAPLVRPLFEAAMGRLSAADQAQDVKEAAISCVAATVAALGDELGGGVAQVGALAEEFAALPSKGAGGRAKKRAKTAAPAEAPAPAEGPVAEVLQALVDRLRNEITRLTAVKAFATIARSPLPLDLSPVGTQALTELTAFLRKANRQLRLASLDALTALLQRDGPRMDPAALEAAVREAAGVVADADLAVAAAALRLLETVVREQTRAAGAVCEQALPGAMALLKSPLLQGSVAEALQALLSALQSSGAPAASLDKLLALLTKAGASGDVTPGAQAAAARCVAALCRGAGQAQVEGTAAALLAALEAPASDDRSKRFSLLCLGELGRGSDLTAFPTLPDALTAALASEPVAEAASLALGGAAAGNLTAYLPLLLQHVHAHAADPKQQYQLLRALNEVIATIARSEGSSSLSGAQQGEVLGLLLASAEEEEECRAVVAECLGHLALLAPNVVLPALRRQLGGDKSPEARAVAVTSLKHAAVERPHPIDALLQEALPEFLAKISDEDVNVRRAAVQLLSGAAHNKPSLVSDKLPAVLPLLLAQSKVDPALIRTVDLGPFKHKIDDGLELRKATFECLGVVLERCYDQLDPGSLVDALLDGLADHYDVKMRCHALLARLAVAAPGAVTASLDRLAEPLAATLQARVKADAVKQEVDRNEDQLRSCLRAVDALARLPGASRVAPFRAFMEGVVQAGAMRDRYAAVREERKEAEGGREGRPGSAGGGDAMDLA